MSVLTDRLAERKITAVFCIDDDNAAPVIRTLDEALDAIVELPPRKLKNFTKLDSRFEELSKLREQVKDLETDEQRAQLGPVMQDMVKKHSLQGKDFDALAASLYQGYKGETAERLRVPFPGRLLSSLSFSGWQKSAVEIIGGATAEARILLLVDEVNDRESGIDLNGVKLMASLWRDHRAALTHVDVIVLTSNCTPEQEFEEARKLLDAVREELRDPAVACQVTRAFVISKSRLDQPPLERHFVAHLNRLQAAQLRGELVALTTKTLQEAITESISWLEQIPLSEFQGSVFVSSENEGAAEIDTLLRLAGIKQRIGLERKLRSDGELKGKIAEMRTFSLKQLDAEHVAASQAEMRKLRELEFERPGEHINSLFAPIACGDVFMFRSDGFERTAMLLANPCDLALRADGTRKLTRGWLVEVSRDAKGELDRRERLQGARAPLSYMLVTGRKDEDTAYLFNNSSIESIDLSILDLCWTNLNGKADFVPMTAKEAMEFALPTQRKRLEALAKRVKNSKFGMMEIWGHELSPSVEQVDEHLVGSVQLNVRVVFDITRMWRLAPEFSTSVLSALAQCIARPVFAHDYLRLE